MGISTTIPFSNQWNNHKNGARVEAIDSKDKADVSKSDVDYLGALQERLERRLDDAQFLKVAKNALMTIKKWKST